MLARVVGIVCFFVAASAFASGHGASSGELHINWWSWDNHAPPVGWFIVDFILFVALLRRFAGPKLRAFFAQRRGTIEKDIVESAMFHARASEARKEALRKRSGVEGEVRAVSDQGRADAEAERARLLREAEEASERMLRDAERIARQEEQKALDRLRQVCAKQALEEAERLLSSEINDADRQRLLEESIVLLERQAGGVA